MERNRKWGGSGAYAPPAEINSASDQSGPAAVRPPPRVTLVIPVYNEEAELTASVRTVREFLTREARFHCDIIIADNASTDRTLEIAQQLAREVPRVQALHLDGKGRGRAVKRAWLASNADVLAYMDVDLSTDLAYFPPLIESLASGTCDLAVGSRLLDSSLTYRGWKREFISRVYNRLVKALFRTRFSDAQCGFKAISRAAARHLLPLVEDTGWFFDSELLILAEKLGYRILDLPVRWVDDPDTRVKIVSTAWEDVKGLVRVKRNLGCLGRPDPVSGLPAQCPHWLP